MNMDMIVDNSTKKVYPFLDEKICDFKYGVVKELFEWFPEADDPKVFLVAALSCDTSRFSPFTVNTFNSGAGLDLKTAYFSAVGESIERYCSAFIDYNELVLDSYKNISDFAVHPNQFAFYDESQHEQPDFPFTPFDENTITRWKWGENVKSKEKRLLPAAAIYLPYFPKEDESLIWYPVSTGLSCAQTKKEAILKGILEVVERDSFSIMWFNELSLPLIDLQGNEYLSNLFNEKFKIDNCSYYLIDTTMDTGIPSVLGILDDHRGGVLVAAASRTTMEEAVEKTLIELAQGRISWKKDFIKGSEETFKDDYSDITDFHTRVKLFTHKHMKEHIRFAFSSSERTVLENNPKIRTIDEQLNMVVDRITSLGYDIYYTDLTTDDINQAGYSVARIVIPGFTEITNDHTRPRIGGHRIYNVPFELGIKNKKTKITELNPVPHPFP